MEKSTKRSKLIIFFIVSTILAFGVGFAIGQASMLGFCVHAGIKILEAKNISLSVNEELIKQGVAQYQGQFTKLIK